MSLRLLNEITSMSASNFDLADYEGFEMYDATHIKLSEIYYSDEGIRSKDSYIYYYMHSLFPGLNHDKLIAEYERLQVIYDPEIKAAFERDVRAGFSPFYIDNPEVFPIIVESGNDSVRLIDIGSFNSNYNMTATQIKKLKDELGGAIKLDDEDVEGGGLNTIIVNEGTEVVMLIEGASAESDPDDWPMNFELGMKSIAGEKFVPSVYEDALAKFRSYQELAAEGEKIQTVVGNSQGGGCAVYIGMHEPDVKVIAINPSPQIASTIKINSKGNANITIVYNDSDPLYNISKIKSLGFETDIPGANIVHVDFGLDRSSSIMSAHTGEVSAIDYDKDGKIDEYEKDLGIEIDNVIPKSVFTGDILGSNASTKIDINRDSMESFADYLEILHTDELYEIITRNDQAYEFNQTKQEYRVTNLLKFTSEITEDLGIYFDQLSASIQDYEDFTVEIVTPIGNLADIASEALNKSDKLPKLAGMVEGIGNILNFKMTVDGSSETVEDAIGLLDSAVEKINETADDILKSDFVGHNGNYAIPDALKIVLEKLNEEEEKLRDAGETLEECVRYIVQKFESTDEAISKMIESNYSGELDTNTEKTYESNQEYIKSLDILEKMNILNQFEHVVDTGVEDVFKNITNLFDPALEIARYIYKHRDDIVIIIEYQAVLDEIEALKNPDYLNETRSTVTIKGEQADIIVTDNDEYLGIPDIVAKAIISVIENCVKPYNDMMIKMRDTLENLDELIVLVEDVMDGLVLYLKPMIETLMYDRQDLGIVRDSLKLNSQVLYRMSREMQNAYEVLNGEVSFMGKDALRELVKELNLRIGALNTLHRDVFGDESMESIEAMN